MNRVIFLICTMLAIAALGGEFIIDLPTQDVSGRVLAIELSGEQLRALGGHAAWLRLYDAQGKVIPWAREQVSTTKLVRTRAQTPITIQEVRKPADGTLEITFGLKTDAAVPEQAFLVFRTSLRNFEQTVQLWGLLPDGSDRALITDGFLFDSTDNIDARNLELTFQPEGCRNFRLRLSAASLERRQALRALSVTQENDGRATTSEQLTIVDQPFTAKSLELWSEKLQQSGTTPVYQELAVPFEAQPTAKKGFSTYRISPDAYPVSALRFVFAEENFSRQVTVEQLLPLEARKLATGMVRRLNLGGLREETTLEFPAVNSSNFLVTFADHDSSALHLREVFASLPVYRLKFLAHPEQFPIRLSAEPNAPEPVYDLAATLALANEAPNTLLLQPGDFSGDAVVAEQKEQPRFHQRFMLYFAVGLAIFAMAFALGLTLRKDGADNAR